MTPSLRGRTVYYVACASEAQERIFPCRTIDDAPAVACLFFQRMLPVHGLPDAVISDRHPKFASRFWWELMKLCAADLKMATAKHPQTDGASEVANRMLENYLRCFCKFRQTNWDKLLTTAEFSYNLTSTSDAALSPFEIDLGQNPKSPIDLLNSPEGDVRSNVHDVEDLCTRLDAVFQDAQFYHVLAKAKQSSEAAERFTATKYAPNDMVWLSSHLTRDDYNLARPSHKLSPPWHGPYKVLRMVGPIAVKLQLPDTTRAHPVVHMSMARKHTAQPPDLAHPDSPHPPPAEFVDGEPAYTVQCIIAHKWVNSTYEFLTHYAGEPEHDALWNWKK